MKSRALVISSLLIPSLVFAAGGDASFDDALNKGLLTLLATAFGVGVLTSLTPCVYPMIPMTLAVFGAKDAGTSRLKRGALAFTYVQGLAIPFALLGAAAAAAGKGTGVLLGDPRFVIPLVLVFIALALSMFGLFEIRLPHALQNRLNRVGGRGYGGAFLLGTVGSLIAAPCVGPFAGGLIAYVATTGNVVMGALALYVFALGLGVLFFAVAMFSLSLPKSGPWMEVIKSFGGIALLIVAAYFLRPILPVIASFVQPSTVFFLVMGGLILVGVALGALHLSFHTKSVSTFVRKILGIALCVVGGVGIWWGAFTAERKLPWVYDETEAFAKATKEGKGVMIDFFAEWCAPCKAYEVMFADPEVYDAITQNYIPYKVDLTDDGDKENALKDKYGAGTLPQILFLNANGKEFDKIGELEKKEFIDALLKARKAMQSPERSSLLSPPKALPDITDLPHGIQWEKDEKLAIQTATNQNKLLLVNFSAQWCGPCKSNERVLADIRDQVEENIVPLKIDITRLTQASPEQRHSPALAAVDKLVQKYKPRATPDLLFLAPTGEELGRIQLLQDPEHFLEALAKAQKKRALM